MQMVLLVTRIKPRWSRASVIFYLFMDYVVGLIAFLFTQKQLSQVVDLSMEDERRKLKKQRQEAILKDFAAR